MTYEVYVRSYADASGPGGTPDGVGDLAGVRERLPHLVDLGVDALWLTPFYPSPMADAGYDVADFRDVEPVFGRLADLDALVADAHRLGLRVLVDIVPNHCSSAHPWFQAALRDEPGARARFLFRPGRGAAGGEPPNNWQSVFGGPAWTRVTEPDGRPGLWYLHLFAPEQPDWDWRHPDVGDDYERTLRFWLDRGVDGFRVDVAHGLVKDAALRDNPGVRPAGALGHGLEEAHSWDQPEVHAVWRRWRRVLDEVSAATGRSRLAVGEVWLTEPGALGRYVRPDELHQAFSFDVLLAGWDAAAWRAAVERGLAPAPSPLWVLDNHDVTRTTSRYGGGPAGLARSRAALLVLLALPGGACLYQGQELGLPEVDVPPAARRDPIWARSGHTRRGRDGCRVPLPWAGTQSPFGFSAAGATPGPWLPMPADWGPLSVAAQTGDASSTLGLTRAALAARRSELAGAGPLRWLEDLPVGVLAFRRGDVLCAAVTGARGWALPAGEVLLASGPLTGRVVSDAPLADRAVTLPPDTAVWLRVA